MGIGQWEKATIGHLDILGHYQFEPCEFKNKGHSLVARGGMTQNRIFRFTENEFAEFESPNRSIDHTRTTRVI